MKVIIIEDERAAARNLTSLLTEICPLAEVLTVIDSIAGTLEWFAHQPLPDLLFMDIHLADGSAFEIFEHLRISCPIIFTTAYDEYALRAFRVNSIDYLLKPIGQSDMERAMEKFERLYAGVADGEAKGEARGEARDEAREYREADTGGVYNPDELLRLVRSLHKRESYRSHFLVPIKGDKLLPIGTDMIRLFYIKGCLVRAVLTDGTEHGFTQTLDELVECLDPMVFFRVNRQYLVTREAIRDIDLWFNSRLSINLRYDTLPEKILVSKARVTEFKEWFAGR